MSIEINEEEYLTATEAAQFLEVSTATFSKFQRAYKLQWKTRPGQGNKKYFRRADLEPLLAWQPGERKDH